MGQGYTGKILLVDLSSGKIVDEQLDEKLYRDFIGGVGLGARLLYKKMQGKVDPLGEQNILGFMPGLLGGTTVPSASRLTILSKSPLTGAWGDTSVGGHIAHEIKRSGYDGILFSGKSPKPVYLLIHEGKAEFCDASHLWGNDTFDTAETIKADVGNNRLRVISIGPAGEAKSLIASIITEREGRAAGRAGLGAVMGSKLLKAVAVKGDKSVPVADSNRIEQLRKNFLNEIKSSQIPFINTLKSAGTIGATHNFIKAGATPIKNWSEIGEDALRESMPAYEPYESKISKYSSRRMGCANCPVGCGAMLKMEDGSECDRPEYETVAGFGPMCLNSDMNTILKANEICNLYGIDTISASSSIAFAIDCYEKGIITGDDTGGIELKWGNDRAILSMLQKMVKREGFGDVLADGARKAAERIGKGSESMVTHVGGQELGYHEPRQVPARGTAYICDPAPGRHTTFLAGRLFESGGVPGPYSRLWEPRVELRDYAHKGPVYGHLVKYEQVATSAGICKFIFWQESWPLVEFISAATGWDMNIEEVLEIGERIQTMRQLFNIRDGISPEQYDLPKKYHVPATMGPYKDEPVDFKLLREEYYESMGWDKETGHPAEARMKELGIETNS